MTVYPTGSGPGFSGPLGYSYAVLAVRLLDRSRDDVAAVLRRVRFTGWLGHPESGWIAVVAAAGPGTVAAGRRGIVGLGELVAIELQVPTLTVLVVDDRQLLLVGWAAGEEIGRYVNNPAHGTPPDLDVLPDPLGVEHAEAFAAAADRPEAGEELADLLAEELDADQVIESERLIGVLRLLGLPSWLVAAASLPKDVTAGPRARELTRFGAGREWPVGLVTGWAAEFVRRRRPPPPPIVDPPRATQIEPWML